MKYLIVDLNINLDGHKLGFVQNLIDYLYTNPSKHQFYFFVNSSPKFTLDNKGLANVKVLESSAEENLVLSNIKGYLNQNKFQWQFMLKRIQEFNIDKLILMELDRYQLEIGKKNTTFEISGIWFRPFSRLEPEGKGFKYWLENSMNKIKKKLTMDFALRNKNLKQVFILNDEKMPQWLNGKIKRFYFLADPCFEYTKLENFDLRKKYNIPADNLILLQFGNIDERKNTENFITALNNFPNAISQKITLLICGVFKKDYDKVLLNHKKADSAYQMICKNEFISNEEMESTVSQSDVILRTNINFFGSSGIVGIAAMHNKPCIVSDFGVMADQVEKYKMGTIINPYDISAIQKTIKFYLENPTERFTDGSFYKESHTLEIFAKTLLNLA